MAKRLSSLFLSIVLTGCLLIGAMPGTPVAHASSTWTTPTTVLQPEGPGTWDSSIVLSGNVILQGSVYKMWFYGANDSAAGVGYATSTDGITWTRYANNPVLQVSGTDYNQGLPYVLFVNGQYEMWFTGQTKATGTYDNIYHATSSDGITWTTPAAISFGDPQSWEIGGYFYVSSVTYANGEYRIYYSGDTNRIGFMTSTDGMNWTKYAGNPVFSSTGSEGPSVAHFTATYTGSGYDLYYGANFPNGSLNHATSPDGITWTRDADNPFYTPDSDHWLVGLPRVVYNGSSVQIWFVQNRKSDSQWAIWYMTNGSVTPTPQLSALAPAKVWVGLKNSDDVGVKFDLKAEAYAGSTLVSTGEIDSVAAGSSGFNNAKPDTIPFAAFSPVDFPAGTQLSIKLSVRNACAGSGHTSGFARLWYNDSAADSQFGATINSTISSYFLRDLFGLATTAGPGPKKTIDIQSGAKCSAFKPFGTWTITP